MTIVDHHKLTELTKAVFIALQTPEDEAQLASEVLVSADLRGIDSHGVARLSGYVRLWEKGRINTKAQPQIVHETLSTATLDGDAGLGMVVASKAMDIAIQKALQVGVGMVAVQNSNHFGIAASHAMKALEHDMIGFAMTNASPLVAPTHSSERLLGTNPICYVFPAHKFPPLVVDMATSAAANGKLQIAERLGKPLHEGWATDKAGNPSTDPTVLKQGGALLPLGSAYETGSHKGYGLAAIVDIMCGVVSGANFGPWVPPFVAFLEPSANPVGKGLGHFVGAMRVDAFRSKESYYQAIDTWIERFKQATPINPNEPVLVHGEPEAATAHERALKGIPMHPTVLDDLRALCQRLGVEWIL